MKEEDDYPLDTFCYYISEIPLGLLHYDRECLSQRVYDGEGKLIDQSYCCSRFSIYYPGVCDLPAYDRHPDETFRGRNAEQIRFQKGDIVEVYCGDEVKLAIVVGTPLTTEWIWERNQAVKDKRGLDELPYDETDDSYTVIDGPGYEYHDHVPSLYVFADFLSHSHLLSFYLSAVSAFVLDLVFMKFLNVAFPPIVPELDFVVVVLDFLAHRIS